MTAKYGDLRKAFQTYSNNGYVGRRGNWKVAQGGYDLWFEVYYDNMPVVDCIDGELENIVGLSVDEFDAICDVIMSFGGYTVEYKYGYDITLNRETTDYDIGYLVGDNGDMEFDSEDAAIADAKEYIRELLRDEFLGFTYDDFDIEVIRLS